MPFWIYWPEMSRDNLKSFCLNGGMQSFPIRFCALFLVFTFSVIGADKDRAIDIRMHRPSKPGEKFRLTLKASMELETERHVGSRSEKDKEAFETDFTGVVTVLKTTKGGGRAKVAIVVEKFMITEDGFKFEGLPKGTRLIASLKDREVVFAEVLEGQKDGKPLSAGIELQALQQVIGLDNEGDATDDDIFGSKEKRKVGDKWPVNKKNAIEDFRKDDIRIDADRFKGETELAGVVKVKGIECYRLTGSFDAKQFQPPVPRGFRVQESGLTAKYAGSFPIDTKLPELETTVDIRMYFRASLRNVELEFDRRLKKDITVTPLN